MESKLLKENYLCLRKQISLRYIRTIKKLNKLEYKDEQ